MNWPLFFALLIFFAVSLIAKRSRKGQDGCDECSLSNNNFVLAANSSATFVFFLYSEGATDDGNAFGDTDANIIANAQGYFDVSTLGASRLWEGLTTAENWTDVAGAPKAETLPDTGLDAFGMLVAAIALASLGTVIVVRRRTTKA